MLLARKGWRVLLTDRAAFPSDIPHGHFLHRHGPGRLARWGLLDRVAALRERPEDTTRFYLAAQGLAPRESFFVPENLARIRGGAPGEA